MLFIEKNGIYVIHIVLVLMLNIIYEYIITIKKLIDNFKYIRIILKA
jgi:hypothetical protein